MNLVPDSIKCTETIAYDQVFETRLGLINLHEIMLDFEQESNPDKLQLFLEMFGIDGNVFDFMNLSPLDRHQLFIDLLDVMKYSGTNYSIIKLAMVLGASNCTIDNSFWVLRYNGEARYNGYHNYQADNYQKFALKINIYGVGLVQRVAFEANFKLLFKQLQPVRLHIVAIQFL